MKKLFLFSFYTFLVSSSFAQAVISKPLSAASRKTIKDFGAVPNDGKDDTWAFIKAGKYFSNLWDINGVPLKTGKENFSYAINSAMLEIPSGAYLVGKQVTVPTKGLSTTYGKIFAYPTATAPLVVQEGGAHKVGLELIMLSNSKNDIDQLVIKGTGKTKPVIKYNDNLTIGFFNNKGTPQFLTEPNYNPRYAIGIGNFLQAVNCKNIVLNNIEVNGNNIPSLSGGKTVYNGGFSTHLIQMGASAVCLINTKNVLLDRLNIHHMTLDGIMVQDFYKDPDKYKNQPLSNIIIRNTICNYNRRQGFSWVGGRGVKVLNSFFSNTGKSASGIAAGNPGAGIDIEPEQDPNGDDLWCIDGSFINCELINNNGNALVNDITGYRTKNMRFDSCIFHDVDGYALWIRGKGFTFNNSKIWGSFVHGNEGTNVEDATRFNNCDFADEEIPGRPGVYNVGYALVESWLIAKRMHFNNCTFRTVHMNQRLITLCTPSLSETDFTIFSNCNFTTGSQSNASKNNMLMGCVFDKNNRINNLNTAKVETYFINGLIFTGSNNSATPNNFILEGNVLFSVANSNGKGSQQFVVGRNGIGTGNIDGYANFNIGNRSCLYAYWDQTIDIGKNSGFINKEGGQFAILSGKINNNGKIILEDGSYTAFFNPIDINTNNSNAKFYYNKKAKMEVNPAWNKVLGGLGQARAMSQMKLSANTKFYGGNAAIPAGKAAL